MRYAHVIFGNPDHGRGQRAESMAHGGPLRNSGHMDHAERNADDDADQQGNQNPLEADEFGIEKGRDHSDRRADLADQHSATRGRGRTQPLQRQDEKGDRHNVREVSEVLHSYLVHCFLRPLSLNIRSMRSVIRKPPTMLLNAAATAIAPKISESSDPGRAAMMMAATTTMASRALVKAIRGVCSSGETRRMTSNPRNPASTKTYRFEIKPSGTVPSFNSTFGYAGSRTALAGRRAARGPY